MRPQSATRDCMFERLYDDHAKMEERRRIRREKARVDAILRDREDMKGPFVNGTLEPRRSPEDIEHHFDSLFKDAALKQKRLDRKIQKQNREVRLQSKPQLVSKPPTQVGHSNADSGGEDADVARDAAPEPRWHHLYDVGLQRRTQRENACKAARVDGLEDDRARSPQRPEKVLKETYDRLWQDAQEFQRRNQFAIENRLLTMDQDRINASVHRKNSPKSVTKATQRLYEDHALREQRLEEKVKTRLDAELQSMFSPTTLKSRAAPPSPHQCGHERTSAVTDASDRQSVHSEAIPDAPDHHILSDGKEIEAEVAREVAADREGDEKNTDHSADAPLCASDFGTREEELADQEGCGDTPGLDASVGTPAPPISDGTSPPQVVSPLPKRSARSTASPQRLKGLKEPGRGTLKCEALYNDRLRLQDKLRTQRERSETKDRTLLAEGSVHKAAMQRPRTPSQVNRRFQELSLSAPKYAYLRLGDQSGPGTTPV